LKEENRRLTAAVEALNLQVLRLQEARARVRSHRSSQQERR
jgi:hypothetical protein